MFISEFISEEPFVTITEELSTDQLLMDDMIHEAEDQDSCQGFNCSDLDCLDCLDHAPETL